MPDDSSNIDDVGAWIDQLVAGFDLTLPGEDGSLGKELAAIAADGIAARSAEGKDPDGNAWKANEAKYAAYKRERYEVDRPGELGGQMLSLTSLLGNPTITADEVEMAYGTNAPPERSTARSGAALRPSELEATDTEKAAWFTESGRDFYAFDETIASDIAARAQEALDGYVEEKT